MLDELIDDYIDMMKYQKRLEVAEDRGAVRKLIIRCKAHSIKLEEFTKQLEIKLKSIKN
jgi:hypothetical protein